VMRHRSGNGNVEYAIHEVYFNADDQPVTWTEDALSPRESTLDGLRMKLEAIRDRMGEDEEVQIGDLDYSYVKEDLDDMMWSFSKLVLDY
jgi:hypothetical protein